MAAVLRHVVQFWARCLNGEVWATAPGHVRSDFLFVQPSGLHGVARLMDLSGMYDCYNRSMTPAHADAQALWADFAVTGDDLDTVIVAFGKSELRVAQQIPLPLLTPTPAGRVVVQ